MAVFAKTVSTILLLPYLYYVVVSICSPDSWDNVEDFISVGQSLPIPNVGDTSSIMFACFSLFFNFFPSVYAAMQQTPAQVFYKTEGACKAISVNPR